VKNKTESIQLRGFKPYSYSQSIKFSIKKKILLKPCVVLNTTQGLECEEGFKTFDIKPENQTEKLF